MPETLSVNGLRAEGGLMGERNEGFQGDAEDTISVVKEIRVLVKGLVAAQAQASADNSAMVEIALVLRDLVIASTEGVEQRTADSLSARLNAVIARLRQ